MRDIVIFEDGALVIKDGYITDIGFDSEIAEKYTADEVISAENYLVLPGFVDCHTHPVFVHTREDEFAMRLQGYSYMEIAKAGGGILNTIKTTRNASEDLLFDLAKKADRKNDGTRDHYSGSKKWLWPGHRKRIKAIKSYRPSGKRIAYYYCSYISWSTRISGRIQR